MANPSRARALLMELDRLAKEYIAARDEYESTRQTFDVAKERLISVRKRAPEVLGGVDWFEWTQKHAEVKLVGLEIGDAILAVLQEKAYSAVRDVITGLQKDPPEKRPYSPSLAAFEIYDTLDAAVSADGVPGTNTFTPNGNATPRDPCRPSQLERRDEIARHDKRVPARRVGRNLQDDARCVWLQGGRSRRS